ncbi:flavodoxin domain-containing protein [Methanosphaerula palustris]|uniref:Flavodoxin n=1 Tax=Methanosphaerula palustris (strain ATCC BAA-1556 / DSM 19958 / E1-9c) TaxID=521011 RepID=B8GJF3_METPE|nr:flavodoxin domain-containing protein [Methanosphaerula palustris]ACL16994.1 flavodoxin [Methanosphaerula palustris E1-9c]
MSGRILIAYISRKGSTAEIARAVGKELEAAGYAVDVADMKTVTSLTGYDAVIIGAPLYMGRMVRDVGKFVGHHREQLVALPVAAFAVGIAPVSKEAGSVEYGMKKLHSSLTPLKPVATTLFAGRLDPTQMSFISRKMMEMAKIPSGDFRDWNAIASWAQTLPGLLRVGSITG